MCVEGNVQHRNIDHYVLTKFLYCEENLYVNNNK